MEKKKYISPSIELVVLDNEISLALESNPPEGPNESAFLIHTTNNNPFQQKV
jgi:hypothetical protein